MLWSRTFAFLGCYGYVRGMRTGCTQDTQLGGLHRSLQLAYHFGVGTWSSNGLIDFRFHAILPPEASFAYQFDDVG